MAAITQKGRPIGLKTPLGDDVLLIRSMTGSEHLGRLFHYEISALSTDEAVDLDKILGQNVTVRLDISASEKRYFNGFVSRFAQTGRSVGMASYQITVRPWLWFLTRRQDCRIFQDMTVPAIIQQVFKDAGFSDFEAQLHEGPYRTWTYCVQYRETDFDFISRLMEQEGIYFYFKHEDGKHTLVLTDSYGGHSLIKGYEKVKYFPPTDNVVAKEDTVYEWALTREVMPGAYALQDFDFEKPGVDLTTRAKVKRQHQGAGSEVYDFPGEYLEEADGKKYATARIQEQQWQFEQAEGTADARGFTTGGLFELTGYPRKDQNREYLIVAGDYELRSTEFETGGSSDDAPQFQIRFTAIESKTPYRTPRFTPKPLIQGPQTAIVVGPSGDEIYTDKYGRVKVQFHWDRVGKRDENSSCWVRVAQVWAGKNWGAMHIPRLGQEVIVEFLEGDPDEPIITGRVYNAEQMPPYDLPANATQSGIKSRSSKGGSGSNFNEIRMEDKKGSEELYIHAEKDHTNITEHDRNEDVGHDRSLHVGHDKSESIDNNKTITVAANHNETIGANKSVTVGNNHTENIGSNMVISVGATLTETVAINYAEAVGAAMELAVGGAYAQTVGAAKTELVGGTKSSTIGGSQSEKVGGDVTENYAKNHTITVGADRALTVKKNLGVEVEEKGQVEFKKEFALKAKKIAIEAEDELNIKVGSAELVMKKNGDVTIKGNKISVKGDGDVILKGSKVTAN